MKRSVATRRSASSALLRALLTTLALVTLASVVARPATAAAGDGIRRTLTVFIDPDTQDMGLIPGPGRMPLELSLDDLNALNTSSDGLTPVTIGDMVMLDLRGRFHPLWVVVAGADGKPRAFCLTNLPASVETAAQSVREEAARDH